MHRAGLDYHNAFSSEGIMNPVCLDSIKAYVERDFELMTWTEPKHSNKTVSKAGGILLDINSSESEYSEALTIVNNWRSSYAYPLNNLQGFLRYKARTLDKEALISQRLKRVPSILGKLKRFSSMQLHRMQDIGGCRAVVSDIKTVNKLRELLVNSKTENKLIKEDNYIEKPKSSGYRGIHLIYKYCGKKENIYNRHLIEVQLRSQVQHAWATTVEIVGTFLKESLKTGEGSEDWLEFFRLTSILFSNFEENSMESLSSTELRDIREKVIEFSKTLYVFEKLAAFSVSTNHIESQNTLGYFLLTLDIKERRISVRNYLRKDLNRATNEYLHMEDKHKKDSNIDVVLVAAESIKSLKKAYPNYFADSYFFSQTLDHVLDN